MKYMKYLEKKIAFLEKIKSAPQEKIKFTVSTINGIDLEYSFSKN